jgi:predicted permease
MIGRTFTASDDHTDAPYAVISYPFWLRRFAGRPDVLGKTFMLRKARLTVIGVAPKGFIGETSGQQPDLWIPLRMQTLVIPGGDRLNDTPPEKAMWLHVFGRLNPGVTLPQAEAEANVIFQAGLESFYGDRLGERRSEFLDQHIGIHAAGRGASGFRKGMSDSLTALLFSVGVLVLITSANLANLLLARGSARKSEIALRLSLGASRGRLLRQLVTESLVLAAAGGLAGIVAAYVFHGALVRMIAAWNPDFQMSFSMAPEVTFFTLAVTVAAWILFGALPAWQVTKIDVGENLKMQSRTATASAVQIRWRQGLVCFQLALSLPLLVGAGVLARTLHNLQRVDLGFPAERLLILQVDARGAGYDSDALDRLTRDLRGEFQQIPGVRSASFSGNGVFSGGNSNLEIEVEGYTRQGNNDRGSSVDAVGARYFSTLGIPILAGREILETDHSGAPRVCVINEAFSRQFFAGRNPIGLEITSREADARGSCRIVGVAANARTDNLRSEVRPRFFFPAPQSPMKADGYVFLVRTVTDNAAIISAARQAIRKMNPELSIESAQTIEQQLAPLTAQNRTTAQLVAAFGCAAIALAAIGLYGVLSYNVGRRKSEIAIRIALGAQRGGVIALLLRETMRVVLLGLILGLGITGATAGLIRSQLYGVSPQDPVVLASAAGLLILVSLTAAYIPARKASTLDPMTTLRGE